MQSFAIVSDMAFFSRLRATDFYTTPAKIFCYNRVNKDRGGDMRGKALGEPEILRADEIKTKDATYKYSLQVSESVNVASYRLPLYSITVEMTREDGYRTEARTGDIFADAGKAVVFYERMVEHLATPIGLPYIVEDELLK